MFEINPYESAPALENGPLRWSSDLLPVLVILYIHLIASALCALYALLCDYEVRIPGASWPFWCGIVAVLKLSIVLCPVTAAIAASHLRQRRVVSILALEVLLSAFQTLAIFR